MTYIYITFKTTNDALDFEEQLKGLLPFWLVPVPRELSHNCGIAARFTEEVPEDNIRKAILDQGLSIDGFHKVTR